MFTVDTYVVAALNPSVLHALNPIDRQHIQIDGKQMDQEATTRPTAKFRASTGPGVQLVAVVEASATEGASG